ncbi:MAG: WS/DGAT domain-containing protein, partial [Sciscionella sp.]
LDPARRSIQAMVPQSLRSTTTRHLAGNRTGAVKIALPTGRLPFDERLRAVSAALRHQRDADAPLAAEWVLRAIGALPTPLHRLAYRGVYRSTWFNAVVSVIPGPRMRLNWRGLALREVVPVLPLAPGVGLSVGLMPTGDHFTVSITTHPDSAGLAEKLAAAIAHTIDTLDDPEAD